MDQPTTKRRVFDEIGRRLKWAPPTPRIQKVILTEADYALFEAIDRHIFLPTYYAFRFQRHLRPYFDGVQRRLTKLSNGERRDKTPEPYLRKPPSQYECFKRDRQENVYGNTERAREALRARGTLSRFPMPPSNDFVHDLMNSCIGATIELLAPEKGLTYKSREKILKDAPRKGMAIPLPGIEQKTLVPDNLLGLQYPGGKWRLFAVEADRNNESVRPTFEAKFRNYVTVMQRNLTSEHWGIRKLYVLIVTTNRTHMQNLMDCAKATVPAALLDRFWFAVEPCFGSRYRKTADESWHVPDGLLNGLMDEPWQTLAGPRDITVV